MKKTALIIAMIFSFITLTACNGSDAGDTPGSKDSTSISDDSYVTAENVVKDGFKQIEHSYDSVLCNFSYGQGKAVNDLRITIDIPDYLVKGDDNENCSDYVRYDKETVDYIRTFEIKPVYKVDSDFVMDESIHVKTESAGVAAITNHHKYDISKGVTDTGCDYVLCEDLSDSFFVIAYIRISDEYIATFVYSDGREHYDLMRHCLNSIQIVN